MPAHIYQSQLKAKFQSAETNYTNASHLEHSGLIGKAREIVVEELVRNVLGSDFGFMTGKVVTSHGDQSREMDVLIYAKSLLPPFFYSKDGGVCPLESCIGAIEVKSRLSNNELKDAHEKLRFFSEKALRPGLFTQDDKGIEHPVKQAIRILFAFHSDSSFEAEVDRYAKIDPNWNSKPVIQMIFIFGTGLAYFNPVKGWRKIKQTEDYQHALAFLALLNNSCLPVMLSRGYPRLGAYIVADNVL